MTAETSPKATFALIILMSSQLITGGTYMVAKIALREFDPITLGQLRFLLAGMVFVPLLYLRGQLRIPHKDDWGIFLLMAALAVPLNQGSFLYGMRYTSAGHGALLYASTPIIILVLAALTRQETLSRVKVAGILIGFAGVTTVLLEKGLGGGTDPLRGDALVVVGVLMWAIYTLFSKRMVERYPPFMITGLVLSLGAVLFLPFGIPSALQQEFGKISVRAWLALFYLAFLTSVVAYFVWTWSLAYLEASKAAVISNLQPLVAAVLGWLVLGEPITLQFLAGAAIVFCGVWFTQRG